MDSITLKGMDFYGYHGCLPEERQKGQHFFVDLSMFIDLQEAGKDDDLQATVNYAVVYDMVKLIVEGEPKNLIEAVAEEIASSVLETFTEVQKIEVTVHKPSAPIAGKFDDVSVTVEREQK